MYNDTKQTRNFERCVVRVRVVFSRRRFVYYNIKKPKTLKIKTPRPLRIGKNMYAVYCIVIPAAEHMVRIHRTYKVWLQYDAKRTNDTARVR